MKRCRECGETKPLDHFYAHPQMADGHLNKCKPCVKARVAEHRKRNIDQVRAYDRARADNPERVALRQQVAERCKTDPELKARRQQLRQDWVARNADKRSAHVAVGNAIRDGRLFRQPCERCGSPKAEAHHDDYTKPLDVRWLCRKHHAERHKELRAIQRGQP
jgi:ribosomal protein S27AE